MFSVSCIQINFAGCPVRCSYMRFPLPSHSTVDKPRFHSHSRRTGEWKFRHCLCVFWRCIWFHCNITSVSHLAKSEDDPDEARSPGSARQKESKLPSDTIAQSVSNSVRFAVRSQKTFCPQLPRELVQGGRIAVTGCLESSPYSLCYLCPWTGKQVVIHFQDNTRDSPPLRTPWTGHPRIIHLSHYWTSILLEDWTLPPGTPSKNGWVGRTFPSSGAELWSIQLWKTVPA